MLRRFGTKSNSIQDAFKETMSSFGSQLMILTAPFVDLKTPVSQYHGMTISSVCSLCVYPRPLVQFNLQIPSVTSTNLKKLKHFAVHIMKPDLESVRLARLFSRGLIRQNGKILHQQPFSELELLKDYSIYQNRNLGILGKMVKIPVLSNSERVLILEQSNVFKVENHEIWIGEVKDIIVNQNDKDGGLLYFNRKFHNIGDPFPEN